MGIEYDPETNTYSCRITVGEKEPIPLEKLRGAMNRSIGGVLGRWRKMREWEITDVLFWFEEGIR